ncbi:7 transmembrane receptor (rhodopsin family)-like protein 2 [Leptotrombidium deliense]|uniref:7 transmembrane receptor (Rhodopsin family)-like protein 2 n=1 Tax=Leptotrombidium deliense TaxID=299467 RepID=A0A443S392_9ACAR|nr:7 transmembrane receptor (rhodopsin family)-like protein 2 [Leptotrombidium deliense]
MTAGTSNADLHASREEIGDLPVAYTVVEAIVAVISAFGNLLTIIVFIQDKKLRKVTNFYIVSLAVADLLVGVFGIPSAIFTRIGVPRNAFHVCLSMLSFLLVLCTVSILNLVAVSLDRFWAILYPLNYHRRMSSMYLITLCMQCSSRLQEKS